MKKANVTRLANSRAVRRSDRPHQAIGGMAGHHCSPAVALLSWTLLCICGVVAAEEKPGPAPAEDSAPDIVLGLAVGYDAVWQGENPTNIDVDLSTSFPQPNAVFDTRIPKDWFKWKEQLYKKQGLKLGISYQSLFQKASDTLSGNDTAWGGWLLIESKWVAINRGKDFEGSLVAALDWRHTIGGNSRPAFFQLDTGSGWPTDFSFVEWDAWLPALYWEQKAKKDAFVVRFGNQTAQQFIDFFRYKDSRTSFTAAPFNAAAQSLPAPQPGLGASFRWTPVKDSEFYVAGTINDANAKVNSYDWDNIFDYGQFFYALEFGNNWRRGKGNFDHLHLLLFYSDKQDTQLPIFENKAGGGFKLAGSKQWERLVGYGSYTYNTAQGGGFGVTLIKNMLTAGIAVQRPLNIGGEVGVGAMWGEPIDGVTLAGIPQRQPPEDQYGMEFYWKILLTEDLWITPNLQFVINPTFNSNTDSIVLPGFKFRFFL
jgi:hypothetical protein